MTDDEVKAMLDQLKERDPELYAKADAMVDESYERATGILKTFDKIDMVLVEMTIGYILAAITTTYGAKTFENIMSSYQAAYEDLLRGRQTQSN